SKDSSDADITNMLVSDEEEGVPSFISKMAKMLYKSSPMYMASLLPKTMFEFLNKMKNPEGENNEGKDPEKDMFDHSPLGGLYALANVTGDNTDDIEAMGNEKHNQFEGTLSGWIFKLFNMFAKTTLAVRQASASAGSIDAGGDGDISVGDLTGNSNAEKVWNYLRGQGFSEASASAILGNMQQESGVKGDVVQNGLKYDESTALSSVNGYGIGLIQWDGARRAELVKYAKEQGKEWSDISLQLEFLMKEMTSGYEGQLWNDLYGGLDEFKKTENVSDAVKMFHDVMERSA